jgi:hypothetical protein
MYNWSSDIFKKYDLWEKTDKNANAMQNYIKLQASSVDLYQKGSFGLDLCLSWGDNVQKYLLWKREGPLKAGFLFFRIPRQK